MSEYSTFICAMATVDSMDAIDKIVRHIPRTEFIEHNWITAEFDERPVLNDFGELIKTECHETYNQIAYRLDSDYDFFKIANLFDDDSWFRKMISDKEAIVEIYMSHHDSHVWQHVIIEFGTPVKRETFVDDSDPYCVPAPWKKYKARHFRYELI